MGQCYGKSISVIEHNDTIGENNHSTPETIQSTPEPPLPTTNGPTTVVVSTVKNTPVRPTSPSSWASPYPYGTSPLPTGVSPSPARSSAKSTPRRFFRRPFPPPSPAKHIKAALARRHGPKKEGTIPEEGGGNDGVGTEEERPLDKSFGYGKNFLAKYELGKEVGRGHFGHTCLAKGKKGELKGQQVAVKIISKNKMTTAISIEDVRREVKILKALAGHRNLVRFYDACEDANNVYVVMEYTSLHHIIAKVSESGATLFTKLFMAPLSGISNDRVYPLH